MRTETTDPATSSIDTAELSPTAIFDLLADDRRRYALHYLSRKVGAVPLGELAEQIAVHEGDPTRDRYDRILTGLYHNHLPKLSDSGVVRYDPERETVALRDEDEQLAPYLKLSVADDLQ
ncbi:hypothetical protein BRD15_12510 [Halobacteriales archaeon SW_6_65_15]|nr:MAG: hypothetical protein BRD15_12510 [Halobacteriales archaeon SW_6_65_15]